MADITLGIIGGTGVYKVEGLQVIEELDIDTPFGKPSSKITIAALDGFRCAFVARHGTAHAVLPTEVPFKANIWALKKVGVKYLLSVSACGSLQEELKPRDLVLVDQFIDRTKNRDATFFGNGLVAHVMFGDPTCDKMRNLVHEAIQSSLPHITVHPKGTYVCMEGPAFSTRAESHMYRLWGGHVIGMTALTEAKLAREAEMASAVVGLVTDYDCWRVEEEAVSVDAVMQVLKQNGENVQVFVKEVIRKLKDNQFQSQHHDALKMSLVTHADKVPEKVKADLKPIIGRYMS
eukprot:GGOE01054399.1.p1 GENE.GGOE01054399.1~~GGOE01054399.1.p1  ORF type:complete len:291 (-),score=60.19 GGOE01054399.1:153-1025(-)